MVPEFHFTVTDVARLLGKSSVTLRGWERQGLITFPRDGTDRKFTCADVCDVSTRAFQLKRITKERHDLVGATMTMLRLVERENAR